MGKREFQEYKRKFIQDFKDLLEKRPPHDLDEQALPSYTHKIPLARWLFWQRIRIALKMLNDLKPRTVLDFGCGAGVLFPKLLSLKAKIFACDLDLRAAKELAGKNGWRNITWLEGQYKLGDLKPKSLDLIIALDVLEHVEKTELENLGRRFANLLGDSGCLLLSGPTESWFYRLGRWISGFSGHYHVRSIFDIESGLSQSFRLELKERLFWPITLFRILQGFPR